MNGDEPETRSAPGPLAPDSFEGFPTVTPVPPPATRTTSLTAAHPSPAAPVPAASTKPADIVPVRRKIGKYSILKEIGRGGMGVVYLAHQDDLNRDVALKVISAGPDADQTEVARFNAEAETAANLHHPNIVPVYDVGTMDHLAYLAMELVDGGSLYKLISKQAMDPTLAATLLEPVARAIHYAHCQGVIHRDIKPSNILLENWESGVRTADLKTRPPGATPVQAALHTPNTVMVPKITDFGLAKRLNRPLALTQTGLAVGTPHYMAPEQALGKADQIGPATDIYALGAVLYEMLTGHPPFGGNSSLETMQQVVSKKPVRPSVLRPSVPPALEDICLKCLEKKRENRYPTAQAVADALHAYVHGTQPPTVAAPAARESSVSLVVRRLSAWGYWPAAALAGVLLTAAATWWLTHRNWVPEQRQWAAALDARARDADLLQLRNAVLLADRGDFDAMTAAGREPAADYADVVAEYRRYRLEAVPWASTPKVRRAVFEPTGHFLLAVTDTRFAALRADTGDEVKGDTLSPMPADPDQADFVIGRSRTSPLFAVVAPAAPNKVAVGLADALPHVTGTVALADSVKLKLAQPLANGTAVLVSDGVKRWAVDPKALTVAPVAAGPGEPAINAVVTVSELGQWLVETAGGWRVLPADKDKKIPPIPSPGAVAQVAFSPTGSNLVAVLRNGGVRLFDFTDHRWADLPADGSATAAAFSPDGNVLVVGTRAGTVRLWDAHARARLSGDVNLNKKVVGVDIAADRRSVVAVTEDQAVHRFRFQAQPHYAPAVKLEPGHLRDVLDIAFSNTGDALYVTTPRGLSRWLIKTAARQQFAGEPEVVPTEQMMLSQRPKKAAPAFHSMAVRGPTADDPAEQVLLGGVDGKLALLGLNGDGATQQTQSEVEGGEAVTGVAFSKDGRKTVAVCDSCAPGESVVRFWKTTFGTEVTGQKKVEKFPFRITCEGFTPDNAHVIFGSDDGAVRLWNPDGPKDVFTATFDAGSRVLCVATDHRGDRILAGCADGRAVVFDRHTGEKLRTLKHSTEVRRAAFDGNRPVTAAADGAVRVWHPSEDFTVGPPFRHAEAITALSLRGNLIAAASRDRTIRVWTLPPRE